ncbi:MAG: hypothetical protein ACFE9Q_07290 [Candidatus Hodarchaeota archaeon]
MVNFLLFIQKISHYSKYDIDSGKTPLEIYKLCSCIRETFCLSYAIRKNNILYLYFQEEFILIKFEGSKLRYLGPNERSLALLLLKALNKAKNSQSNYRDQWEKSTPGIYVRTFFDIFSFMEFLTSILKGTNFLIVDYQQVVKEKGENFTLNKNLKIIKEDDFFIIPTYIISKQDSKIIKKFKELKSIKLISLSKINGVENKILYINFLKDQQAILRITLR